MLYIAVTILSYNKFMPSTLASVMLAKQPRGFTIYQGGCISLKNVLYCKKAHFIKLFACNTERKVLQAGSKVLPSCVIHPLKHASIGRTRMKEEKMEGRELIN
jgi:hypothetical protein